MTSVVVIVMNIIYSRQQKRTSWDKKGCINFYTVNTGNYITTI